MSYYGVDNKVSFKGHYIYLRTLSALKIWSSMILDSKQHYFMPCIPYPHSPQNASIYHKIVILQLCLYKFLLVFSFLTLKIKYFSSGQTVCVSISIRLVFTYLYHLLSRRYFCTNRKSWRHILNKGNFEWDVLILVLIIRIRFLPKLIKNFFQHIGNQKVKTNF